MKNTWNIVHDCDDDNGEPTCWAKEINHPAYGCFVWLSKCGSNEYAIEVVPDKETITLATCNSLSSAKHWVTTNIG